MGARAERVEAVDSGDPRPALLRRPVEAERLLVATGRRPNVDGLGLEQLDVELTKSGITVDERMRAADGVWAIGDPSGVALLTHVGKYQARVAAANIAGGDYVADYRAIPAAVFTDPQVASVGDAKGDGLVTATYRIEGGRLSTYERPKRPGLLKLAGRSRPSASSSARWRSARRRASGSASSRWRFAREVPSTSCSTRSSPIPTFSEAIFSALQELEGQLAR